MRIALFHGWELTGSGSNEYTRYLARALARLGHDVHVLCREPVPEGIEWAREAWSWDVTGASTRLFQRAATDPADGFVLHRLPHHPTVRPVFVTDKQRAGPVKAFTAMTDTELTDYRALATRAVGAVLDAWPPDFVHANHVTPQPEIAASACQARGIPFVIYPHGSAIEYTLRWDERFRASVGEAIAASAGLIIGSHEVRGRLFELYPNLHAKLRARSHIVGVGVDTQLFEPVPRSSRRRAIDDLIAHRPGGGKPPAVSLALQTHLDAGDLTALRPDRVRNLAYTRDAPDQDAVEKLRAIPWDRAQVLLFVGALAVGKGLQSVIAALPEILERAPDTYLIVVGSGAYREALEALVYALSQPRRDLLTALVAQGNDLDDTHLKGPWPDVAAYLAVPERLDRALGYGPALAERVCFVGRLHHGLLRHLFPCADVAVFPSVIPEAYPLVLMESLANGVLPAASDFSGFAEGLDDLVPDLGEARVGSMRLPVEPERRVAGIASRLGALLEAAPRSDLGGALRRIAVSRYDWAVRARAMLSAYRALTAPQAPPR